MTCVESIGPKLKRALKYLGQDYRVRIIDGEDCIYRDLGNGFDIEVSGIETDWRSNVCGYVCVWNMRHCDLVGPGGIRYGARSVEYVWYPRTLGDLKNVLDGLVEKYSGNNPPTEDAYSYATDWLRERETVNS